MENCLNTQNLIGQFDCDPKIKIVLLDEEKQLKENI